MAAAPFIRRRQVGRLHHQAERDMDQIYTDDETSDRRQATRGSTATTTRRCSRHVPGPAATAVAAHAAAAAAAATATHNSTPDDETQPSKKVKLDGVRTWARSRSLPIIDREASATASASAAGHVTHMNHVISQPTVNHFNPAFNGNSFGGSKRKREEEAVSPVAASAAPTKISNSNTRPASAAPFGSSTKISAVKPATKSSTTTTATAPLPPVNINSLREIDLAEIFKNPRLRHDIVFDPQLQFRPNLDGERGKRKRQSTQRYWDGITAEVEGVWAAADSAQPCTSHFGTLTTLFTTLRQVLVSLLPVKDRETIESDLDSDLVQQQLCHHCFDFVSFSHWLSNVFKAHCAPMRDSWVDQMVVRINAGWKEKNSRKLTEGLRMIFAILEAMKLDVANHQIRSLRPILVDTAVDFEQDYYEQVVEKRRFDIASSCQWFAAAAASTERPAAAGATKHYKTALIGAVTQLITCSSSDFPATFGFDFARLSAFRSDLRQLVCLQLCSMLLQQLVATRGDAKAKKLVADAEYQSKLKTDCLAIVLSSSGNSKWTKNVSGLALELAKRVEAVVNEKPATLPSTELTSLASNWLTNNILPSSAMYKLVEKRLVKEIVAGVEIRILDTSAVSTNSTSTVTPLIEKLSLLTKFHWDVFSKYYIAYVESAK
ncbi:YALIA101S11e02872g1_1 [Yarrowia lipolytica]|nr:YALIA101S11e02872g1_1 [Yarrowia lipolytica]